MLRRRAEGERARVEGRRRDILCTFESIMYQNTYRRGLSRTVSRTVGRRDDPSRRRGTTPLENALVRTILESVILATVTSLEGTTFR